MKAFSGHFFAFCRWAILAGVVLPGMSAPVQASDVSAIMREMEAREAVGRKIFGRAERFLETGKADFRRERTETVVLGLTELGFSPDEPFLAGKIAETGEVFREAGPRKAVRASRVEQGNAYLLAALESLSENGTDENVMAAMNFARKDFRQVPESRARVAAALPDGGRDAQEAEVLAKWATFAERAAVILAGCDFSLKVPGEVPAECPVSEFFVLAAVSAGVSGEKKAEAQAAVAVTPEKKRFFEICMAGVLPPSGYFLVAQTNVLRE